MKLYAKNSAGTVTLLASSGGATGTVSSVAVSGGTTGLTTSGGPITTSGTITLAGTVATTNGGTGLTSFTSGGVVYASSSSALATGSVLSFDGTIFSNTAAAGNNQTALVIIRNSTSGTAAGSAMYWGNDASLFNSIITKFSSAHTSKPSYFEINNVDNAPLTFAVNNAERMRVVETGLVIGTTTPISGYSLTVNGQGAFTGPTSDVDGNGGVRINYGNSTGLVQRFLTLNANGTTNAAIGLNMVDASNGGITFSTREAGTLLERFRINYNSAWGIGGANYGTAGQVLTSGGSGAAPTWASAGGGSGFTAKTTNYTAVSGDNILANTSAGSWTLTLPASPSTGNAVQVMDSIGTFGTYPLTVARNGSTIMSAAENMTMAVNGAATTFVYNGSTWRVI
jgi:hypothetical protein